VKRLFEQLRHASRETRWRLAAALFTVVLLSVLAFCATLPRRRGEELCACGRYFPAGTPIVLWNDPGGYDAYQRQKRFTTEAVADGKLRYDPLRGHLPQELADRVAQHGWRLDELRTVVHAFVLHFDACGTSRQCFKVLQDVRTLSVHFMLDVDGTIYQTLDLQERAWHATIANDFSIGVEIANPGCAANPDDRGLLAWYEQDADGWRLRFPDWMEATGIRTAGFVARPARNGPVAGLVHGRTYWQFDYTEAQYRALAHLCAAVSAVFPRIRLEVPRNPDGSVRTTQLSPEELRSFDGIIGHLHIQAEKSDPGPALQWDRLLAEARKLRDSR
jgi:N-acetylmuramoyl-L-alanine amidase